MGGVRQGEKTGRAQDHGHDAQTAGRKIQRMIAAMTADVGMVRIHETRIFPSMDHWDRGSRIGSCSRGRQAGSRRVDGVGAGAKIPHAGRLICAPRSCIVVVSPLSSLSSKLQFYRLLLQ